MTMSFRRGDQVEVVLKEEGFTGSYYPASIITPLQNKEYIVQYKSLRTDDNSGPLREFMSIDAIRPAPPEVPVTKFRVSDRVDAYDNDGWWVGRILRREGSKYLVKFETTKEVLSYQTEDLRIHQDWCNGKWVSSRYY